MWANLTRKSTFPYRSSVFNLTLSAGTKKQKENRFSHNVFVMAKEERKEMNADFIVFGSFLVTMMLDQSI